MRRMAFGARIHLLSARRRIAQLPHVVTVTFRTFEIEQKLIRIISTFHFQPFRTVSLCRFRLWIRKRDSSEITATCVQKIQYRDFIPNSPPVVDDDGSEKFARLEQLVQRVNTWCGTSSGPLACDVITLETLNVPVGAYWHVDGEATLRTFPSKYVAILRVFYHSPDVQRELRRALRICSLRFEVGVRDFLPRHVSGGGFFRKPQFELLSTCISRANDWIRRQSVRDASQVEKHLKPFGSFGHLLLNERSFEFKNAQCLEVWMRSLHHVDSGLMHCSSDRGDYLRMFRACFVRLVAQAQVSGRGLLPDDDVPCDDNETGHVQTIHLSSIIFTPADSEATVAEIKRKMHTWVETCCKEFVDDANDEIEMNSRKPRVLSAETVEIFTKDFSEQEIRNETENTFQFNRIGTMNAFLYMAFRIYVDVGPYGRHRSRSKSVPSVHPRHQNSCSIS